MISQMYQLFDAFVRLSRCSATLLFTLKWTAQRVAQQDKDVASKGCSRKNAEMNFVRLDLCAIYHTRTFLKA